MSELFKGCIKCFFLGMSRVYKVCVGCVCSPPLPAGAASLLVAGEGTSGCSQSLLRALGMGKG